jgi:AcrR family transcriptional regulator
MASAQTSAGERAAGQQEARRRRRSQLLDAADRAIRRRGAEASMDEIASEAGVSKPILYRHFGDKDGLYRALAQRYVEALLGELEAARAGSDPRANIAAGIDAYLAFIEREPEVYRFLLGAAEEPRTSAIVGEFRRRLAVDCAFATAERLRRAGVDAEIAEPWAYGAAGMVRSVGVWWLETRTVPRARLVEQLTSLLWDGFSRLLEAQDRAPRAG